MARRPVSDLSPHPFSIKIYGEPDDELKDNLAEMGLTYPIEIDGQGRILSGTRRWQAAKTLGWNLIDVKLVPLETDAEARKRILVANHYRNIKTPFIRKREADAYRQLLADNDITKEQLESMAKDQRRAAAKKRDRTPRALASRAAGMSETVYDDISFITDDNRAEQQVDESLVQGRISKTDADDLKKTIHKARDDVRHNRQPPTTVARDVRKKIRTAERDHGYSYDERRGFEVDEKVEKVRHRGRQFAAKLRDLQHDADVKYLTSKHALHISAVLKEIEDAAKTLIRKAGRVRSDEGNGQRVGSTPKALIQ